MTRSLFIVLSCALISMSAAAVRADFLSRDPGPTAEIRKPPMRLAQRNCPQGHPYYCATVGGTNWCCSTPSRHVCIKGNAATCYQALTPEQQSYLARPEQCTYFLNCN